MDLSLARANNNRQSFSTGSLIPLNLDPGDYLRAVLPIHM
jgi:hypothetical protein